MHHDDDHDDDHPHDHDIIMIVMELRSFHELQMTEIPDSTLF
jgi:hypothetical protein